MFVQQLFFQLSGSNCGMEFCSFYGKEVQTTEKDGWGHYKVKREQQLPSYALIAEAIWKLSRATYPAPSQTLLPLRSYIVFSENGRQFEKNWADHASSPFQFAEWLKKEGEKVVEGPWERNENSGSLIRVWFWFPSDKFKKEINKLTVVLQQKENNKAKCTTSTFSQPA